MNRSKSRVTRKKVIPKHFQKSQTSLSQILTTASYKKRIKELQKNNKVLAVTLQDTRIDLSHCTTLLQRCANEDAKIIHAKAKMKNMVTCIQTLVTDLNDVMSCLDPKPISLFTSSPDQVRLKIRRPDLDPIEESDSDEDCEKNESNADMSNPEPLEQSSKPNNPPAQFLDALKDSNVAVEDQVITGTPVTSVPPVASPGSPLTPVLDISQSDEYFQYLLNLNIKCFPPKKVAKDNEANTTSPLKGSKSLSKIPIRNKDPVPMPQPVIFSPPTSKLNRKTFVVLKETNQLSETSCKQNSSLGVNLHNRRGTYKLSAVPEPISPKGITAQSETSCKQNSSLDVNLHNRRGTYKLSPVPEPIIPKGITAQSETIEKTDTNVHCSEDMELTSIIPIHKISPVENNLFTASNAIPFSKEALSVVSEQENVATASNNNTSKFKSTDNNLDMDFTCVIPMHVLPFTANNPTQGITFASTCADDLPLNLSAHKSMENTTVESDKSSGKSTSKLASNKQSFIDELLASRPEEIATVSDDSPLFKCPDPVDSKVTKDSLKRRSSVSSKVKRGKVSDSKATLKRTRRSSVNSKDATSPKSPKMSMDLKTISPIETGTVAKSTSKTTAKKRKTVTFREDFSSDFDTDDEILRKESEAVDMSGYKSSVNYESNYDCNSTNGFSSFGRCNSKSPIKSSKKRHFTFEKSSKVPLQKDTEKKSINKADGVGILAMDDSSSFEIKALSPKYNSSENSSSPLESSKKSNKNKSSKICKQLKSSNEKTATSAVTISKSNATSKEKFKNAEVESTSVLNTVNSPADEKSSAYNAISSYKKSVQSAFNECYDAFKNIETREPVINDGKSNSKVTGRNKDPLPLPVPESNLGVVKKKLPPLKKRSRRLSQISNSTDDIKNIPKPSQSGNTKLDELLANLDSSTTEDSGCNSKDGTCNLDLVQSVTTDLVKRPFSGVSERNSKKRATDYSSDLFNEIEAICPQETIPICLETVQQTKETVDIGCEQTEVYNVQDILKANALETKLKKNNSPKNNCQKVELKAKNNSNKIAKDTIQVIKEDLVRRNKNQSSTQADEIVYSKADDRSIKIDKSKSSNQVNKTVLSKVEGESVINEKSKTKNIEVDILAIRKTPLKNIQLTSTKECSLNEIDTSENKIVNKQISQGKKIKKEKKTKSKETVSSHKSNHTKKSDGSLNDQNIQPLEVLEPLPICATDGDNSFTSSKNSTSTGNERPRRARPISFKEPSLNCKMRR